MREILFRGRDADGQWREGAYVPLHNGRGKSSYRIYTGYAETDCDEFYPDWFEIDKTTVGEYTGRRDKYDRKIYEGDILGAHLFEDEPDYETRVVVEWHETGWYAVQHYGDRKPCYDPLHEALDGNRFKIIGNIHDNPELLEEKA